MQSMKKLLPVLFSLLCLAFMGSATAQQRADVALISPPQPVENDGKVEVLEFFSYACPHCAVLEPALADWVKRQPADVKFKRIPMDGINGFNSGAALYYSLEAMGQIERLHQKIFDAFHKEHLILANPAILNKWLEQNGVDPKQFEAVQKSFSVASKIQRARKLPSDYKVESVPTLVVQGRNQVIQTSGPEKMFGFVEQLINQERAAKSGGAPASPAKK